MRASVWMSIGLLALSLGASAQAAGAVSAPVAASAPASGAGKGREPSPRMRDRGPAAFSTFQAAQGELSTALARLLVVTESYPALKANQGFRDLQVQIVGTENRVAVARHRYIQAVRDYNVTVQSFPSNRAATAFGFRETANISADNEMAIARPPTVGSAASGSGGLSR